MPKVQKTAAAFIMNARSSGLLQVPLSWRSPYHRIHGVHHKIGGAAGASPPRLHATRNSLFTPSDSQAIRSRCGPLRTDGDSPIGLASSRTYRNTDPPPRASCGQILLRLLYELVEGAGIMDGQFGQYLAVNRYVGFRQPIHEPRIAQPSLSSGGTDPRNPEPAKVPFSAPPIAECAGVPPSNHFHGGPNELAPSSPVAFRLL